LALASVGRAYGGESGVAVADPSQTLQEITVVGSTPVPGASIDMDKIPGNVQVLSAEQLSRQGPANLTAALNSSLSSINVNDDLDDPFQPDILYRGFEASPVLGTPQGLAVYQNGVRINEAFGDTVNWDLLPDAAIGQVELVSYSPLYGLNALGGAIAVTMKNGFTYHGTNLELLAGSHGNRSLVGQVGDASGLLGAYVAGRALDSDGWREFSGDRIRSLYAVTSLHTDRLELDLSYTHADNLLRGQGASPVQELAVSRSLVFTGPQSNSNGLSFFALNATFKFDDGWSIQGVAYYRDYAQKVSNGNTTNYTACSDGSGVLCQPDGVIPITNLAGQTLPDISRGGAKPIGENDFESVHTWGRGLTVQISNAASIAGHDNQLSTGGSVDYAATRFYTRVQLGVISSQLLVQPSDLIVSTPEDSAGAIANGDAVPAGVDAVNRSVGVYLTDTLNISPEIGLTASARFNVTHVDLVDQLGANLTGTNRFAHFNPAVGATYKVLPAVTLYGGSSTNTRTPTASEIECSDPQAPCLLPTNLAGDPPNLRQVVARTWELGARGTGPGFSGRAGALAWSLSAFRTLLQDDIYGVATSLSQGFFQNIGDTRRRGIEVGLTYRANRWSAFLNYSLVQATFCSSLLVPSPSNPHQDLNGDVHIQPGDRLPGIPLHRARFGIDFKVAPRWSVGVTVNAASSAYSAGDAANVLASLPGYAVVGLYSSFRPLSRLEFFSTIDNLLNRKYATWGILSDPTGVGAPGIPPDARTNDPRVNNQFLSPAAPLQAYAGVRLAL
jgi:iron complex outermembrane receptor protein